MPYLGEDVGAVAVVTVRLAIVGGEARASQDGAHGGALFLCAPPLAAVARAVCVWTNGTLSSVGVEGDVKRTAALTAGALTILCTPFCTILPVGITCGCGRRGISPVGRSPSYRHR